MLSPPALNFEGRTFIESVRLVAAADCASWPLPTKPRVLGREHEVGRGACLRRSTVLRRSLALRGV